MAKVSAMATRIVGIDPAAGWTRRGFLTPENAAELLHG